MNINLPPMARASTAKPCREEFQRCPRARFQSTADPFNKSALVKYLSDISSLPTPKIIAMELNEELLFLADIRDPWEKLDPVSKTNWAGEEVIVARQGCDAKEGKLVAVKEIKLLLGKRHQLRKVSCPNVVEFLDVHTFGDSLFLLYEYVEVSLQDVVALTSRLPECSVSFICREVNKPVAFNSSTANDG